MKDVENTQNDVHAYGKSQAITFDKLKKSVHRESSISYDMLQFFL